MGSPKVVPTKARLVALFPPKDASSLDYYHYHHHHFLLCTTHRPSDFSLPKVTLSITTMSTLGPVPPPPPRFDLMFSLTNRPQQLHTAATTRPATVPKAARMAAASSTGGRNNRVARAARVDKRYEATTTTPLA